MVEMVKSLDAILIVTNNNYTDTSLREELRTLLQRGRKQNLFAVKSASSTRPLTPSSVHCDCWEPLRVG